MKDLPRLDVDFAGCEPIDQRAIWFLLGSAWGACVTAAIFFFTK